MMLVDGIPYRRLFPWLHLVRSIGLAFSIRQMLVAAGALCVLALGQSLIDRVFADNVSSDWSVSIDASGLNLRVLPTFDTLASNAARPWDDMLRSAITVGVPHDTWKHRFKAVAHCVWSLAVWGLFGVVLCRLAAFRFVRDESGSFRKSVQFGITRWIHGMVAPLLPLAAALIVMIPAVLALVFVRIPGLGWWLAIVTSPISLVCGLMAAYMLFAVTLGWPLMLAAVATDDSDAFGGFSRSYSLWTGRPWYFAWCWIVASAVGSIMLFVASALGRRTMDVVEAAVQFGVGDATAAVTAINAVLLLLVLLIKTYGISFFWTNATIVYVLLRGSVDRMPLDRMAPDDDERPPRDPLPVVGMPAMEQEAST